MKIFLPLQSRLNLKDKKFQSIDLFDMRIKVVPYIT